LRYRYDIEHNNNILSIICHVVYATIGYSRLVPYTVYLIPNLYIEQDLTDCSLVPYTVYLKPKSIEDTHDRRR